MSGTFQENNNQMPAVSQNFDLSIKEIAMLLRRNIYTIFSIIFFVLVLTAIFLSVTPRLYTASSVLQINIPANKVINIESVTSSISADDSAIVSELDILESRSLASKVIEKLGLENDPEFNGGLSKEKFFAGLSSSVMNYFGQEHQRKDTKDDKSGISTKVINQYLDRLVVVRRPHSYTITVKFSSHFPQKTRDIVNAIAEEYINSQLARKFEATEQANQWLSERLVELEKNVHESEVKVQNFREQNNLLENASGVTITDQQLSEINTQLVTAHAERAKAEAKLSNSRISIDSSPEVLNSGLIQQLRGQETELLRKKADLSNRYGPKHPKMININAEITDLNQKIRAEIGKITESLQNEVEVAKSREEALTNSLEHLKEKTGDSSRASVQLSELTREMNANRTLYESFLTRFKQTSESKGTEQADARIISKAETPVGPSYPNPQLFFLIALVLGILLGVITAFLIESLDHSFRQAQQLRERTGLRVLAMLPEMKGKETEGSSSIYYESIRAVIASIHFPRTERLLKTIMVTSSIPDEGKSFFSHSLASILANSGKKTILVDTDLKRASLSESLVGESFQYDLSDFLTDSTVTEEEIILKAETGGPDFIPARCNIENSQDLLSSKKMQRLMDYLSSRYDYIIFDTAPLMAISDALIFSSTVDTCLFVVRWGVTPQGIVMAALQQLKDANAPIAGAVLTRVDFSKHKYYGAADSGYYHGYYKEYYRRAKAG